jgi:hypothetical protein
MPQSPELERGLEAFRRLLSQAHDHEEARVDAIVALCQRPVVVPHVASAGAEGFRTVMTRENIEALPMFTDEAALRQCALERGWTEWQEPSCMREIPARHALRWAHAHGIEYVVIDLGTPYSIEIHKGEFEPVLAPFTDVETAGPFAATGTLSEQLVDAIRHHQTESPRTRRTTMRVFDQNLVLNQRLSQQPIAEMAETPRELPPAPVRASASVGEHRFTMPAPYAAMPSDARPFAEAVPAGTWSSSAPTATSTTPLPYASSRAPRPGADPRSTATEGQNGGAGPLRRARTYTAPLMPAATTGHITAPSTRPDDEVLEAWASALRSYPQVEWACVGDMVAPTRLTQTTIGIALNPLFIDSINDIQTHLRGESLVPQSIEIRLIDTPELAAEAKERAVIFYPWKS